MFSFLTDLLRSKGDALTVIVMDEEPTGMPRQHRLKPRHLLVGAGIVLAGVVIAVALFVLALAQSGGSPDTGGVVREQRIRLAALEDSLSAQQAYLVQLRNLMMGGAPGSVGATVSVETERPPSPATAEGGGVGSLQPPSIFSLGSVLGGASAPPVVARATFPGILFPVAPPVRGFLTRGVEAQFGHYAVDVAAETGTPVHNIADGSVLFADWTHEGGYTISVQHADGYVSLYKHNDRLLRQPGERVRARDVLALSGNTGEITTGPHVHFELWRDGVAQDPRLFVVGW